MDQVPKTGFVFQSSNTVIRNRFVAERKVVVCPLTEILPRDAPELLDLFNLPAPNLDVIFTCPIFVLDLLCDGIT